MRNGNLPNCIKMDEPHPDEVPGILPQFLSPILTLLLSMGSKDNITSLFGKSNRRCLVAHIFRQLLRHEVQKIW